MEAASSLARQLVLIARLANNVSVLKSDLFFRIPCRLCVQRASLVGASEQSEPVSPELDWTRNKNRMPP